MLVGYARTSTLDQRAGFEAQRRELKEAGCEKVFAEQVSSVAAREKLEAALDFIREGDVFVVTKLDRLARSMRDLVELVDRIDKKGASLRILAMQLDTKTANGRLMLEVFGAVASWERTMMLERQREGIAKAKAEGRYKGRAPTARNKSEKVLELHGQGLGVSEIVKKLEGKIGRSSVYRILNDHTGTGT